MHSLSNTSVSAHREKEITNSYAIRLSGVSKEYRLYKNLQEQAMDVLGLSKLRFWRPTQYKTFKALNNINLEIKHGERVGIIGRNGAGKTTLLKLITRNFVPTSGEIEINGDVQALMQTGLGFHGEFTGYENIQSSLIYSGLSGKELEEAIDDIIEFCELGEFLHQPVKTYSLGMRTRLQFAAATAIKPDIVIVDEVLGAGDAYFNAKSSNRMAKLAESGCTLLIVSHSMQQILQFCHRVIWFDKGRVIEDNDPLPVIKAYERATFEQGSSRNNKNYARSNFNENMLERSLDRGISRWEQKDSLLFISHVSLKDRFNEAKSNFKFGELVTIEIEVQSRKIGVYPCHFLVLLFNSDGIRVTWHLSDKYLIKFESGKSVKAQLTFDELLLNSGTYMISTAIYEHYDRLDKTNLKCYDLLSKSFEFRIENTFSGNPAIITHPSHWQCTDTIELT
jgi:lipopolysaccharide transport system ATP-binding protein